MEEVECNTIDLTLTSRQGIYENQELQHDMFSVRGAIVRGTLASAEKNTTPTTFLLYHDVTAVSLSTEFPLRMINTNQH